MKDDEKIKKSTYQYSDPNVVFKNLDLFVHLIVNTDTTSLIVTGQPGVGKTYTVTNSLEKYNADYVKITGRSTAQALYIALYENSEKIIFFDELIFFLPEEEILIRDDDVLVFSNRIFVAEICELRFWR